MNLHPKWIVKLKNGPTRCGTSTLQGTWRWIIVTASVHDIHPFISSFCTHSSRSYFSSCFKAQWRLWLVIANVWLWLSFCSRLISSSIQSALPQSYIVWKFSFTHWNRFINQTHLQKSISENSNTSVLLFQRNIDREPKLWLLSFHPIAQIWNPWVLNYCFVSWWSVNAIKYP